MLKTQFIKYINNKFIVITLVIFIFLLFFKLYQIELKTPFGYDQVDNAWAAKNLIINHEIPLVGMVAKANSRLYIGPLYYYFVSVFYFLFNLNPMASLVIGVFTSIFNFWVIFFVVKKILNIEIAIIAVLLNTFNFNIIRQDSIQWPVQLLPSISLLIFYCLYKFISGEIKFAIPLAILVGISFNLHFTAIFFPIIFIFCIPFIKVNSKTIRNLLLSLLIFILFLVPNIIYVLINKSANYAAGSYFSNYYHGIHLVRLQQLLSDMLIQFDHYLIFDSLKPIKFLLPLFFIAIIIKDKIITNSKKLIYLVGLWFIVPWFVLSTYSGELSDYYFIINRYIALMIIAYIIYKFIKVKNIFVKATVFLLLVLYCLYALNEFIPYKESGSLYIHEENVKKELLQSKKVEFQQGVSESYIYYYYMKQKGISVY